MKEGTAPLGRPLIAILLGATLLWALVLSASPGLHERIHPDAKDPHHECAITLITAGNYHHTAAAPFVDAPVPPIQLSEIPALNSVWVRSPFLSGSIFEHAPPVRA